MNTVSKQEKGFTLLEVLAAIVIISIVSLALMAYFGNALSYSKTNQNKTIMVNLARNALVFVEKQDFDKLEAYFQLDQSAHPSISGRDCTFAAACMYTTGGKGTPIFPSSEPVVVADVLNPLVNGVQYEIQIEYQAELHRQMLEDPGKQNMGKYMLPVKVVIRGAGGPKGHESQSVVEGYVTSEKIR